VFTRDRSVIGERFQVGHDLVCPLRQGNMHGKGDATLLEAKVRKHRQARLREMVEYVDLAAAGEDIPVKAAIPRRIDIVEIAAQGMVLPLPCPSDDFAWDRARPNEYVIVIHQSTKYVNLVLLISCGQVLGSQSVILRDVQGEFIGSCIGE
jgi:hypothetical protein